MPCSNTNIFDGTTPPPSKCILLVSVGFRKRGDQCVKGVSQALCFGGADNVITTRSRPIHPPFPHPSGSPSGGRGDLTVLISNAASMLGQHIRCCPSTEAVLDERPCFPGQSGSTGNLEISPELAVCADACSISAQYRLNTGPALDTSARCGIAVCRSWWHGL